MLTHVLVEFNGCWTNDITLLKKWERNIVLLDKLLDLSRSTWLLLTELVAWNSVDFQALVLVLFINALQLLVVVLGQTSVGCNVNKEHSLFTGSMFSDSSQALSVDILDLVSENVGYVCDWFSIFEPDLHFLRESFSISLEMWEVIQACCKLVFGIGNIFIIDVVGIDTTNPEVSNG